MDFSLNAETWTYSSSTSIHFGQGCRSELGPLISGKNVLVISSERGKAQFYEDSVLGRLEAQLTWFTLVQETPDIRDIEAAASVLKGSDFDAVIAFGGGSAIDFAKATTAMLAVGGSNANLDSLIEDAGELSKKQILPIYAVPTTAGTGSEVTPFATIWDHARGQKMSLLSDSIRPTLALVDPELTHSLPARSTFSSGLDALNQALESVWNKNRSPVTLALAARSITLALKALPALHQNLSDRKARNQMAEASLLAGLCIAQTKTSVCHAMSYPLTAKYGIPHGFAVAFTMSAVLESCVEEMPELFEQLISLAGLSSIEDLVDQINRITSDLKMLNEVLICVDDPSALFGLSNEMLSSERANNFVLDLSSQFIERVLSKSLGATN